MERRAAPCGNLHPVALEPFARNVPLGNAANGTGSEPRKGRFPGCGKAGRFVFTGLLEGNPSLVLCGKLERGSAQALRKNARDQREKCVFVLTKGMSVIGPRAITRDELEAWFSPEERAEPLSAPAGITGLWQATVRNGATFESGERNASSSGNIMASASCHLLYAAARSADANSWIMPSVLMTLRNTAQSALPKGMTL